ncbi:Glycine betaine/carnitine transport ATP-binding protein GbuA [Limihaloglobus sulfuriphilus]|uniref:Glycine betaine/carnitine transport ATP-binding protein GbuA n=1 Tax=Limihaloglobus sulfuriphilus TaxID=1851148 RepID=A0A1Q2MHW6_9BACT|nr:glycine betaine/L-proline ABC transporter ATP-binding protein [Limihaloglobus sulfuriphilus]AQQ72280.1 Glycine betaine/carnitine transport ATP-binding protein GbuA [Limihaloglobus sulfuriphilus]
MKDNIKIQLKDITVIFGKKRAEALKMLDQGVSKNEILEKTGCTVGVNKASFDIKTGEVFVVMGLSGSGKSTLLRCLNRLIEPTAGDVIVNGRNITKESDKELLETRRTEMSMVFQKFGLLPHKTIIDNVAFGLEIRGESGAKRLEIAQDSINTVGLEGFQNQYPSQLSGGMQQRVGLARALANNPEVLLMDEAFSALDPLIRADMQDQLLELQNKLKKTVVFITHDLDEAIKLGDRIAIMKDGFIEQIGTAEDILTEPASEYVQAFVSNVDRKSIITANTLMFEKPQVAQYERDGVEVAIRKMRKVSVEVLPVVDNDHIFKGFVWLKDLVGAHKEKKHSIKEFIQTQGPMVNPDATVEQMLPLITGTEAPVAVTDEQSGKLKGIVTQISLIVEATSFDREQIEELKENLNEQ